MLLTGAQDLPQYASEALLASIKLPLASLWAALGPSEPLLDSVLATKLEAKPSKTSETQVKSKCNENMKRTC